MQFLHNAYEHCRAISIGSPMRPNHAETSFDAPGFAISCDFIRITASWVHTTSRSGRRGDRVRPACRATVSPESGLSRTCLAGPGSPRHVHSTPAQNPGRDLRPHFLLSSPHAASLLAPTGKLTRFKGASRTFDCHPQSPPNWPALRAAGLTRPCACRLLRAPEAVLGLLHRGAKGVAVVTCPSSSGHEPVRPSPNEVTAPRSPS